MRVISKREKGTFPTTIGKLIGKICACIASSANKRNQVKVTGFVVFLYHEEEYKETGADIEIALPISGRISIEDPRIELKTLPGIKTVSAIYRGL
jgi:effector-binding domain-containing protein